MATTTNEDAADAAGQAAYDQAEKSHWPPTKQDVELIGAAAGAAAGTVIGGPIGAVIGTTVGGFIGGIVYDIVDAIPAAGDNPASRCVVAHEKAGAAKAKAVNELGEKYQRTNEAVMEDLGHYGYSGGITDRNACRNPSAAMAALDQNNRQFFKAMSAVTAEYATLESRPKSSSGGFAMVLVLGAVGAIGTGLLQKLLRR